MRTSPWSGERTHAVLTVGDRESIADAQRGRDPPDGGPGRPGMSGRRRALLSVPPSSLNVENLCVALPGPLPSPCSPS